MVADEAFRVYGQDKHLKTAVGGFLLRGPELNFLRVLFTALEVEVGKIKQNDGVGEVEHRVCPGAKMPLELVLEFIHGQRSAIDFSLGRIIAELAGYQLHGRRVLVQQPQGPPFR